MELIADNTRMTIQLSGERSASQVDELIGALAELRAQMLPPVPEQAPGKGAGSSITVHDDPLVIAHPVSTGGAALMVRSEGLGWLRFNLSPEQCAALRTFFSDNAA